jgi:hypothetical protein
MSTRKSRELSDKVGDYFIQIALLCLQAASLNFAIAFALESSGVSWVVEQNIRILEGDREIE